MKKVLVLDAIQRSALSTTRSLGRQGVPVITADDSTSALAGCSRFSEGYFVYPSPRSQPDKFIAHIVWLVDSQQIDIILPMTELTSGLLLQHRDRLPDVLLPFPEPAVIETLSDKCALMRLAESLGVPYPRTWFVDSPAALPKNLRDLPYPLVLKPGKSWSQTDSGWVRAAVSFADEPASVHALIKSNPALQTQPFMLQECVPGFGQGVFALYDHGTPLAFFSHRRIREKPPSGGVSVLSESVPVDPVLLAHTRALLDAVAWHGVAMVEFKVAADGTPYLMEVNTRFWGSLQLAIDAGVDFPWLLYNMACSQRVEPIKNYKVGTRLRWLLGDLDNLYLTLKEKELTISKKLSAIMRFLTPHPFKTKHEVNRWHDHGPFIWELKQYFKDILK